MIPVLLHCLFHLHRPSWWTDDWLRRRWYCRTCTPRAGGPGLFLSGTRP